VRGETKTKDNIFCTVEVSIQYRLDMTRADESAVSSVYKVENFSKLLSEQVHDILRTKLSRVDLDHAFHMHNDLQADVENRLADEVRFSSCHAPSFDEAREWLRCRSTASW